MIKNQRLKFLQLLISKLLSLPPCRELRKLNESKSHISYARNP
jgi:hypothetical protein